ncbi:phage/plasmid replication protein, II/X family [Pseudidiomarina atlantica]|nr:phage/plasmid replication protein, II/X family [Pseudidiomarina atlantica]
MCDWLTVVIECPHEPIPSGALIDCDADGNVTRTIVKRTTVRSSFESSIQVKTNNVITRDDGSRIGTQLYLDGNFAKFLQGHNVFGSLDIPFLVAAGVQQALNQCQIPIYPFQLKRIMNGEFKVKRVDLTASYDCGTSENVDHWLQSASVMSRSRSGKPEITRGTVYFQKHSRRWSVKFYNKHREILKNKIPLHLLNSPIPAWTDGKLRAEVVIRSKELQKIAEQQLDNADIYGSDLTPKFCSTLFNSYMERIDMSDVHRIPQSAALSLPNALRGTYELWLNGFDMKSHLSTTTFYRHRREISSRLGVDISLPPPRAARNNVVPLLRVIEAKPVEVPNHLLPYMIKRGDFNVAI